MVIVIDAASCSVICICYLPNQTSQIVSELGYLLEVLSIIKDLELYKIIILVNLTFLLVSLAATAICKVLK